MKKISVFLMFLIFSPILSFAQVSSDGSNEASTTRRERIYGWRRQSSEVQQKINALPPEVVTSVPMPVLFGVTLKNISPNFGDPRDGGARTHEGEDIMAVKGTPIVSPTPAVVLRTGFGSTEGNYVYTANSGGETFVYMHLDRIGEGVTSGASLETGSLIGYVGNTGNASGGAAHLHFEIHASSREALDPFPRLTKEFTPEEKINFLTKILTQNTDPTTLSSLLVSNFRSTFVADQNLNITLPIQITDALNNVSTTATKTVGASSLPAGDLDLGSRGILVTNLQKYLISKSAGAEAVKLKEAGATGYFGPLTQKALAEFQLAMNIYPADGYYGPKTRVIVAGSEVVNATPTGESSNVFTRNLFRGLVGEDVRVLQKFLNNNGFFVSVSGAGSMGSETTYFGGATESAVIKFQVAKNISPHLGYVGEITRKQIELVSEL